MADSGPKAKTIWMARGNHWSTDAVFRVYLDDIEKIFDVMEAYIQNKEVPENPYFRLDNEHPIVMETDYRTYYRKEDLESIQPKIADRFDMRVGWVDLSVIFDHFYIGVSASGHDPLSRNAFLEIQDIIKRRKVWFSPLRALSWLRKVGIVVVTILAGVNLFVSNRTISSALFVASVAVLYMIWSKSWVTRKGLVVFRYSDAVPPAWKEHAWDVAKPLIGAAILWLFLVVADRVKP